MPTADQIRIAEDRARPRLMELWWALRPLLSVVRFMQTGAHPDDEISGMLAALGFRDGLTLSYACSTRGEGGQNDIGTEAGLDLGALRTREMERACDVLGMRMYWHSTHPKDSITDFGFSKSGVETLGIWGRDRTILRFAEIIRTERPDIICPTFLDVPGQHGHHRAMTEAAHAVMAAAADPSLPTNLPPWQVKKLYLPAWSGAGTSYDDDLPPPPATLVVAGTDVEPMTGWTWDRIGQQSRTYHRTQGMGRWVAADQRRDWLLHLAESHVQGPDHVVWSGLPRTVGDLADVPGAEPIAEHLQRAQTHLEQAVAAFPNFDAVATAAGHALGAVDAALEACPVAFQGDLCHRLEDKRTQLGHVLRLALGIEARAVVAPAFVAAGTSAAITVEVEPGTAASAKAIVDLPQGWSVADGTLQISSNADLTDPYRATYDPRAPEAPRLHLSFAAGETQVTVPVAFDTEPVVVPQRRVTLTPAALVMNTAADTRALAISVSELTPAQAEVTLQGPTGWKISPTEAGFTVDAPADVADGVVDIQAYVDGAPGQTVRQIAYDHVAPTARVSPAQVKVGVFGVTLPPSRVGYVGAGTDRVGHWLRAIGMDVTDVSDGELGSASALAAYDAIVIGLFAMRFRPGLISAMPLIHQWAEAGGTLVTLYHRPWDNWDPDQVPPRRLEIGQPSLRWRVTNAAAPVTQLAPHPILETPNPIGPSDWEGWVKERGLYFAKSWDPAYTPLLAMSDADEDPLHGSLLVADIGQGRHIHTSLILHHQMAHLVPGAFRLMANFVARRS